MRQLMFTERAERMPARMTEILLGALTLTATPIVNHNSHTIRKTNGVTDRQTSAS